MRWFLLMDVCGAMVFSWLSRKSGLLGWSGMLVCRIVEEAYSHI